jgi:hypothetical protein
MPETTAHPRSLLERGLVICCILWLIVVNVLFFSTRLKDSKAVNTLQRKVTALWSR